MKSILVLVVSYLTAITAITAAAAGGISSGGGESYLDDDEIQAWFANPPQKIDTCLKVGKDFGLSSGKAEALVNKSIGIWQKYFKDKDVYSWHPNLGFSREFDLRTQCQGNESLTIYLGVSTPEIEKEKAKMNLPVAMAKQQSYDTSKHWGKGFIWVAKANLYDNNGYTYPKWNEEERFVAIMLHELGHVFGTPHVEGTIMTERIVSLIRQNMVDYRLPQVLQSVDHNRELLPCKACPWSFREEIRVYQDSQGVDGLTPEGQIYKKLLGQIPNKFYDWTVSLAWTGETEQYVLAFHPKATPQQPVEFVVDVKNVRKVNDSQVFKYQFGWEMNYGHIAYGFINANGNNVPVMIEYNLPQDNLILTSPMADRVRVLAFTDSDLAEIANFSEYGHLNLRE